MLQGDPPAAHHRDLAQHRLAAGAFQLAEQRPQRPAQRGRQRRRQEQRAHRHHGAQRVAQPAERQCAEQPQLDEVTEEPGEEGQQGQHQGDRYAVEFQLRQQRGEAFGLAGAIDDRLGVEIEHIDLDHAQGDDAPVDDREDQKKAEQHGRKRQRRLQETFHCRSIPEKRARTPSPGRGPIRPCPFPSGAPARHPRCCPRP